jgi:hypothetical protein
MSEDRQTAREGHQLPSMRAGDVTAPQRRPAAAWSASRRGFLRGAGGLTAAALVGGGGGWSVLSS